MTEAPVSSVPEPPSGEWWSDEPEMETYQHLVQMLSLIATLRWLWRDRTDYFVGGNLTVYYSPHRRRSEDFRGPDFFVALGVDGTRERRSWVVWEEGGRYPNVIVELLSDSTETVDRTTKKQIYAEVFRTPEYFLFDPHDLAFEGYRLVSGHYEAIPPDDHGHLASDQLDLLLGVRGNQLRFFTRAGELVPTPDEAAREAERRLAVERQRADEEHRRADEEHRRADEASRRAERAEAALRELRGGRRD